MKTKYVGRHTVIDPDTRLPVELEIRKLQAGAMVGLDGSWLQADAGPTYSPYDRNVKLGVPQAHQHYRYHGRSHA